MPLADDRLDDLLRLSSPRTTASSGELTAEFRSMATSARERAGWRRALRRTPLIAGAAIAIALGGAGVATANGLWSGWAADPDGVLSFTLPSGTVCEHRIGNFQFGDPAVGAAAGELLAVPGLVEDLPVDEHLQMLSGNPGAASDEDYRSAFSLALSKYLLDGLAERGFDTENASFEGATTCANGTP
jgi:hypothetical protein